MCQLSQLCWNFLSARRTKVLLKVPFYFISAGGGWRSHWEHLSLYWLYTKILYLMQYCTHSVLNIEKKALLLLLKLISRKISWNLISRKNIPVMNQPQRKHVIRDWAGWGCGGLSCEFESPCRIRVITPIRYLNTENAPVNN